MHIYRKRRKHNPALPLSERQKIDRREAKIERLLERLPDDYRRACLIKAVREEIQAIIRLAQELHDGKRQAEVAKTLEHLARERPPDRRLKAYRDAKAAGKPVDPLADLREALAVQLASVPWPVEPAAPSDDSAAFLAEIRAAAIADGVPAEDLAPESAAR